MNPINRVRVFDTDTRELLAELSERTTMALYEVFTQRDKLDHDGWYYADDADCVVTFSRQTRRRKKTS